MTSKYQTGGVAVTIGSAAVVELKPRIYRGRLTGFLFESDKTFLLPGAMPSIRGIKRFYDEHPGLAVLVSGHTDRQGTASYNLTLSDLRAAAVAEFLQDQVDAWLGFYTGRGGGVGVRWGTREDLYMLSAVPGPDGVPYYTGPISSTLGSGARAAVDRFRADQGLGAGSLDAAARKLLVEKYMATDETTLPPGTTIERHGCGEHHPVLATADGVEQDENRRVEVFLFEGPIDPAAPGTCPSGGCTQYPEWVRRTVETVDFSSRPEIVLLVVDELGLPLRNAAVRLKRGGGTEESVSTDGEGKLHPRVDPGETIELAIEDAHECGAGDGITTPSGTHCAAVAGGGP